jgi:uncharacterized protein (TIGR00299 family) protein
MRLAYFDCFSGISGDMVLGALLDAGADASQLRSQLVRLPLSGWELACEKVKRKGLAATYARVTASDTARHRHLPQILEMIDAASLPPRVAARAKAIFTRLGESEARMHNLPLERVHFHEVGAVDSIVDIVGASIAFELLSIDAVAASEINVGGGTVQTSHGILPVPAPATADLLRNAPTYSSGVQCELATPTGAAILVGMGASFGPQPRMRVRAIGYGAGTADLAEQPNVLRVLVGDADSLHDIPQAAETVVVLETNLDDMNPQLCGYVFDRALELGALDVFSVPVQMKKNRTGLLLTVLCAPENADALTDLLFRETTTLGVRSFSVRRMVLPRETVVVKTGHGEVRVKVARAGGRTINVQPEYEDCARIAAAAGVPLKQVMAEALAAYHRSSDATPTAAQHSNDGRTQENP